MFMQSPIFSGESALAASLWHFIVRLWVPIICVANMASMASRGAKSCMRARFAVTRVSRTSSSSLSTYNVLSAWIARTKLTVSCRDPHSFCKRSSDGGIPSVAPASDLTMFRTPSNQADAAALPNPHPAGWPPGLLSALGLRIRVKERTFCIRGPKLIIDFDAVFKSRDAREAPSPRPPAPRQNRPNQLPPQRTLFGLDTRKALLAAAFPWCSGFSAGLTQGGVLIFCLPAFGVIAGTRKILWWRQVRSRLAPQPTSPGDDLERRRFP